MKVFVISDIYSSIQKEEMLKSISELDLCVIDLGAIKDEISSDEDNIVNSLQSQLQNSNFNAYNDCLIGITQSGNDLQIFANKIPGVSVASCANIHLVSAIRNFDVNGCDIASSIPINEIFSITTKFITNFGKQ